MIFTQIPGDYAPLYGPLNFRFEDQEPPRELTFILLDSNDLSILATKRLWGTNSGEVNIAPLLRRRISWNPQATPMGFSLANTRIPEVTASVEGVEVTRRILPVWPEEEIPEVLLSPMPDRRVLIRGEGEELFLNRGVAMAELEIQTPWEKRVIPYRGGNPEEFQLFRFDSREWPEGACQAELRLLDTSLKVLHTLRYTLIEAPAEGLRVAWVSRLGSIEHYTFPVVKWIEQPQQERPIVLVDGRSKRLRVSLEENWQVTSAYETPEMQRALTELATTQAAWWIDEVGNYHEIGVESAPLKLQRYGLLSTLEFTLCPTRKQLSLWS